MGERIRYELATNTAEMMHYLLEAEYQQKQQDLDGMMLRLKDLSAYSLTHAEIMDQRQGPELLALGMFFGMTSDPRYHQNQARLGLLSQDALTYPGYSATVEDEVAQRMGRRPHRKKGEHSNPGQPRLF